MEAFVNLVSNLGFPIACATAMFWYLNKERESHKEEVDLLRESHKEDVNILREAILELKEVCKSISDRLGGGGA